MLDRPNLSMNDPWLYARNDPWYNWEIRHMMRYIDKPHLTMECLSCVYMADVSRGITKDELTTIVHILLIRLKKKPFRDCEIHPVSDQHPKTIMASNVYRS